MREFTKEVNRIIAVRVPFCDGWAPVRHMEKYHREGNSTFRVQSSLLSCLLPMAYACLKD